MNRFFNPISDIWSTTKWQPAPHKLVHVEGAVELSLDERVKKMRTWLHGAGEAFVCSSATLDAPSTWMDLLYRLSKRGTLTLLDDSVAACTKQGGSNWITQAPLTPANNSGDCVLRGLHACFLS